MQGSPQEPQLVQNNLKEAGFILGRIPHSLGEAMDATDLQPENMLKNSNLAMDTLKVWRGAPEEGFHEIIVILTNRYMAASRSGSTTSMV